MKTELVLLAAITSASAACSTSAADGSEESSAETTDPGQADDDDDDGGDDDDDDDDNEGDDDDDEDDDDDDDDDGGDDDDDDDNDDDGDDDDGESSTGEATPSTGFVSGCLRTVEGDAIEGFGEFCGPLTAEGEENCRPIRPEEDGCFELVDLEVGSFYMRVRQAAAFPDRSLADFVHRLSLGEGEVREYGDIILYDTGAVVDLEGQPATDVMIDERLTVRIDPATTDFEIGAGSTMAGVFVPEEQWAAKELPDGARVVAAWTLKPFASSEDGFAIKISETLGQEVGEELGLYYLSLTPPAWGEPTLGETVVVGEAGIETSGDGFRWLTQIIVAKK